MQTRKIGPFEVSALGLGCMGLSHGYGPPTPRDQAERVLLGALDAGYTFFDTAAVYGVGHNETLVGEVLGPHRDRFTLASKCGLTVGDERQLSGDPANLKDTCERSLKRLKTDVIDLYYLHRWDRRVPVEDSVGALADLVAEGKIRAIGLSEVSAPTLRRAHAVHPITALQTEYSPWTRNPEIAVLDACRELGVAFVAFSPVGRGFLAGGVRDLAKLGEGDMRKDMPRFQGEAFEA
ncbi:MAG: aldo/keto reductase, partial [Phenylobacterium sp.]|uniref:aldo/keto reductase n=1 Tax=Phenylobacterium sp. TaxID=1871053 RepID=UPI0026352C44